MRMEYSSMLTVFQTIWHAAKVSLSVSSRLNVSQAQNQSHMQSRSAAVAPRYTRQKQVDRSQSQRIAAAIAVSTTVSRQSAFGYESQLSGVLRVFRVHCATADNQQLRSVATTISQRSVHRTPGRCDQFTATGNCGYGDQCKFQHIGADGQLMNEQGEHSCRFTTVIN